MGFGVRVVVTTPVFVGVGVNVESPEAESAASIGTFSTYGLAGSAPVVELELSRANAHRINPTNAKSAGPIRFSTVDTTYRFPVNFCLGRSKHR